jgi:hypothetical protein
VVTKLSAIAFDVKSGGSVRELKVDGGLRTHVPGVPPLELQGEIETLVINDGIKDSAAENKSS